MSWLQGFYDSLSPDTGRYEERAARDLATRPTPAPDEKVLGVLSPYTRMLWGKLQQFVDDVKASNAAHHKESHEGGSEHAGEACETYNRNLQYSDFEFRTIRHIVWLEIGIELRATGVDTSSFDNINIRRDGVIAGSNDPPEEGLDAPTGVVVIGGAEGLEELFGGPPPKGN